METKEKVDLRKVYVDYKVRCIEELLKDIKEINKLPDILLTEKLYKEGIFIKMGERKINEQIY